MEDVTVNRDKAFELTDDEKLKFRKYLEFHSCSIKSIRDEIIKAAEDLHSLQFKLMCLQNELVTNEERVESFKEVEKIFN